MPNERSKYDTDPLDPNFVRRTEEISGATRDVGRTPAEQARRQEGTEAPTRLFEDELDRDLFATPYPSVFNVSSAPDAPPPLPSDSANAASGGEAYYVPHTTNLREPFSQRQPPAHEQPPSSRVIPGIGLPENLLVVAPYAPLFIGAIAALVELFLVPRDERRTRFHAAQGLALHGAVLAGALLLRIARFLALVTFGNLASGLLWVVWLLFFIATIVFFIQTMMRVWRGETVRVEAVGEATRWLDAQIAPRNTVPRP